MTPIRITQVGYYSATDYTTPIKTVDFTYDNLGNLLTWNDGTTSATYTYDDLQRKIGETVDYGAFTKSQAYTYNNNGTKKTFTGPDNNTYAYTYDSNNRLSGIQIPGQGQMTYNTYQWNSPTKRTLPGGSTTDYTYDSLMQIQSITATPVGNITEKNTEHGTYTYQYDNLYRLTNATNPTQPDEAYTYDALGNRITSAQTQNDWTYNQNNELETNGDTTYEYDANGNMIKKTAGGTTTSYVCDIENRLTEVWNGEAGSGTIIATYYYDPFGRRLWKDVDGTRTCFVYSDEGLIGEYDANGTEIRTYGYVPGSNWTTAPLFLKTNGIYYWYQNGHLGTPQKIINTSGATAWAATYNSFGNILIDTEAITNNLRFPGHYYDQETGLYYNYQRYYDPTTGRYLRTDPQGDGINLYVYCYNNPITFIDPMGLCVINDLWNKTSNFASNAFNETVNIVSSSKAIAIYETAGGLATIGLGILVAPVNPLAGGSLIFGGVGATVQGSTILLIEYGFKGDTSGIPNPWIIVKNVGEGIWHSPLIKKR